MIAKGQRIDVIGVPLDLGVSKLGVDLGPTAIRYAGIFEAFDFAGFPHHDHGNLDIASNFSLDRLPEEQLADARLAETVRVAELLAAAVLQVREEGNFPLVLGGDHSTAIGMVAGLSASCQRLGVLWIDAHPDANTPETSPSNNIHGMPLAVSLGRGYAELVDCLRKGPKVQPQDVCIVGAKDIDPGEAAFLDEMGVTVFTTFDIMEQGIAKVMDQARRIVTLNTDAVYASFDTDVIDETFAPGTGIRSRGGLNYREITFIMEYIGRHIPLAGMDVIEVNPLNDRRNSTAVLAVELTMAALGARWTAYERDYLGLD